MMVYISGPIDGKPDRNEKAFRAAELYLQRMGYQTLVPHDIPAYAHDGGCPRGYAEGEGHSSACWIRSDLIEMLVRCDAIYMIEGWEMSRGAKLEFEVAVLSGFLIWYQTRYLSGPRLVGNSSV